MTQVQPQVQPNEHVSSFQAEIWSDELLASMPRWQEALELLSEEVFGGMAQALTILINETMKLERSAVLGTRPFERSVFNAANRQEADRLLAQMVSKYAPISKKARHLAGDQRTRRADRARLPQRASPPATHQQLRGTT